MYSKNLSNRVFSLLLMYQYTIEYNYIIYYLVFLGCYIQISNNSGCNLPVLLSIDFTFYTICCITICYYTVSILHKKL